MNTPIIPHPELRHPPGHYPAAELERMLVDDGIHFRPLGGAGDGGVQWMTSAIDRIAKIRGQEMEAVFQAILDQIEAATGHRWVAVA